MHYFSGVKSFWPVKNNQSAIVGNSKLNRRRKAFSIATYDLSMICTNIAHNKLKNLMRS